MSEKNRERHNDRLATPQAARHRIATGGKPNPDRFGRATEAIARFMGTPQFILWMTVFCTLWLGWNTLAPDELQFDPRALNFTLLTLALSLQASYAAPLLLLAQNRQDDRDRVIAAQDRQRDQQNLEETQYLTREIASLRIALREVATRDYVRSELRDVMEELQKLQQVLDRSESQGLENTPETQSTKIVTEDISTPKRRLSQIKVKDVDELSQEHGE
ncbi:DUF1003 domain-containing protein [Rothia sp. CCM 9418]|uniref:DUF1003 domain-containing protein n=1 Tax=Rothia sp. CCM 9418 TaxID=3402661 RepID=UPI003AE3C793